MFPTASQCPVLCTAASVRTGRLKSRKSFSSGQASGKTKLSFCKFYPWQWFDLLNDFSHILSACCLIKRWLVYILVHMILMEVLLISFRPDSKIGVWVPFVPSAISTVAWGRKLHYNLTWTIGFGWRADELNSVLAGCLCILILTSVGSDRYKTQKLHFIIAISNKVRYPEIFLTTTCNPN